MIINSTNFFKWIQGRKTNADYEQKLQKVTFCHFKKCGTEHKQKNFFFAYHFKKNKFFAYHLKKKNFAYHLKKNCKNFAYKKVVSINAAKINLGCHKYSK